VKKESGVAGVQELQNKRAGRFEWERVSENGVFFNYRFRRFHRSDEEMGWRF
jgi:hypothetical protein